MDIIRKHLTNGQYLTQKFEKTSMFWHHTIGTTAMSAWRWWNSTPQRVGTPFIIDYDGPIYECFDPAMWAYHLGVSGDDNYHEKHSINIEIVSAGPLRYKNKQFRFYPLWPNKLRYTVIPKDEVFSFDEPWKGHRHWHKYSDAQIDAAEWLAGKILLENKGISLDTDLSKIFDYNEDVLNNHLSGMWTHNTVREDKSDIFPYPPFIDMLNKLQSDLLPATKAFEIPELIVKGKKGKGKKGKKS